jgi:hypothetical protein
VRLGVNLPSPFWISSRIRGCGCLTILLWPLEVSLWLLAVVIFAYIALAKYLWPQGWWGKAVTILIPVVLVIIGSVSGAASSSQQTTSASTQVAQAQNPVQSQSPSPTAAPSHHTKRRVTWAAFIRRYPSDRHSFLTRDAPAYCSAKHPYDSRCVQQLRKHAKHLGIIPVHNPSPVTPTSSSGSGSGTSGGGSCYPTTSSGHCYEPGEFAASPSMASLASQATARPSSAKTTTAGDGSLSDYCCLRDPDRKSKSLAQRLPRWLAHHAPRWLQDAVEQFGAGHGSLVDLLPVNLLGRSRRGVADKPGDLLDRSPLADITYTNEVRSSRGVQFRPIPAASHASLNARRTWAASRAVPTLDVKTRSLSFHLGPAAILSFACCSCCASGAWAASSGMRSLRLDFGVFTSPRALTDR